MGNLGCSQTEVKTADGSIAPHLFHILQEEGAKRPFFVVGQAFQCLKLADAIKAQYPQAEFFDAFLPNPTYESVMLGKKLFRQGGCDFIAAIGGGSAIDVAKCIKAYAFMEDDRCCLNQTITENNIKILAVPTTAGTGSEATHFAVIYYQDVKQSVSHESLLPSYVILCADALESLPLYQRKVTMLDALCHGIESLWSINSTEESEKHAADAISLFMSSYPLYLRNVRDGNMNMLCAANSAGKAIDITKTTAAHAMSYKLTSLYGIAHGHSAALCLPRVWEYMLGHMDMCIEPRGIDFLKSRFHYIGNLLGCSSPVEAVAFLDNLMGELELEAPKALSGEDLSILVQSVNAERLANSPVMLDEKALTKIYNDILSGDVADESTKFV